MNRKHGFALWNGKLAPLLITICGKLADILSDVREAEDKPWSLKMNTLCARPSREGFSIWFWLDNVLPCPADAGLGFSARRESMQMSAGDDSSAARQENQEVVIEVQMYPPNVSCALLRVQEVFALTPHRTLETSNKCSSSALSE